MLKISLKNQFEALLLLIQNLIKVMIHRSDRRFLHLSLPIFKRQLVLDVLNRRVLRYEIGSWFDWKTGYQIFGADSYNPKPLGIEKRLNSIYEKLINTSMPVILDFGGNIGLSSLYFSNEYPQAKIYCIEIQESNISLARHNLAHLANVKVIHGGAASKLGKGYVQDPNIGNDGFRMTLEPEGAIASVDLIDVDSLLVEHKQDILFIVKVDIEGSEAELFSANTGWVDNTKLLIVEPHDWLIPGKTTSKSFIMSIAGKNRDFLIKGENIFSFLN